MRVLGIDPGLVKAGVALVENRPGGVRLTWWNELRGGTGLSKDFPRALVVARDLAQEVRRLIEQFEPDEIAVEAFLDQGSVRRGRTRGSWLAVMACQAIHDELVVWDRERRVHWQPHAPALSLKKGTGTYVQHARLGSLRGMLEPLSPCPAGRYGPDSIPEHAADAFGHALYLHDQLRRRQQFR